MWIFKGLCYKSPFLKRDLEDMGNMFRRSATSHGWISLNNNHLDVEKGRLEDDYIHCISNVNKASKNCCFSYCKYKWITHIHKTCKSLYIIQISAILKLDTCIYIYRYLIHKYIYIYLPKPRSPWHLSPGNPPCHAWRQWQSPWDPYLSTHLTFSPKRGPGEVRCHEVTLRLTGGSPLLCFQ